MGRVYTPAIGLVVAVALAMAAVVGALALPGGALAAVNAPVGEELAQAGPAPQGSPDVMVTMKAGETKRVDITDSIPNGLSNASTARRVQVTRFDDGKLTASTSGIVTTTDVSVTLVAEPNAKGSTVVVARVPLRESGDVRVVIQVTFEAATPTTVKELAPLVTLSTAAGSMQKVDVAQYFNKGTGGTISYMATDRGGNAMVTTDPSIAISGETRIPTNDDGMAYLTLSTMGTPTAGQEKYWSIKAMDQSGADDHPTVRLTVRYVVPGDAMMVGTGTASGLSFKPDSMDPGKNTRYTVTLTAGQNYIPGAPDSDIVLDLVDFQVPSNIDPNSITIEAAKVYTGTTGMTAIPGDLGTRGYNQNPPMSVSVPEQVTVDDEEITLVLADLDGDADGLQVIRTGTKITITFRASAGISNPTEGGPYDEIEIEGEMAPEVMIARTLSLSEEDGNLGDTIDVTGKGFKNGTTLKVFIDRNYDADDDDYMPMLDANEDVICTVLIDSNDVGICRDVEISHPVFRGGATGNWISAVDGQNNYVTVPEKFILEDSITATPDNGSPGELILVRMVDFPAGAVSNVELARQSICDNDGSSSGDPGNMDAPACTGSVDATGNGSFSITIPDWAEPGSQELRVHVGSANASTNITVAGPRINVTPGTVVANQRVSVVGSGFTPGSELSSRESVSKITINGRAVDWARINGGETVNVDNGGNWSASIDMPLAEVTTSEGMRTLRITDSMGRTGTAELMVHERTVTIDPQVGRVGTLATVQGMNFPGKNDEGSSFNITVRYEAGQGKQTTVSAVPDASGRFEVQLRIPTTAAIPSTNTVKVEFDDDQGVKVVTSISHDVPEGAISLSETSGAPGTVVTINGEGFKSFAPVSSVMIGAVEVTPSPKPTSDAQGMMEFAIRVPGLDVGIQTVEVKVGNTTASTGFTVTPSGVSTGSVTPAMEAVENLGDNFVRAFNFNNDLKSWSFYDPMAVEASTLDSFITGESYWMLIKSTQEVILNGKTRNLTCVAGNCWNLVVW